MQGRICKVGHWSVVSLIAPCAYISLTPVLPPAVMPYFPYSRQSKKKSHRGSITARMIANLLKVAGVNHIITIDLHASQMQGFFHCPVDNLFAQPLLAQWIKTNMPNWKSSVVVSKNPGGTKRVTSLADALKLSFGIIMTDRRRPGSALGSMANSTIMDTVHSTRPDWDRRDTITALTAGGSLQKVGINGIPEEPENLARGLRDVQEELERVETAESAVESPFEEYEDDGVDPSSSQIITGRLVHGRIVDDENGDSNSPHSMSSKSTKNGRHSDDDVPEHMSSSVFSTTSSVRNPARQGLGGSGDAADSDDDEEENLRAFDSTVTLVGNVKDKQVFIVDDMIDKAGSWIAAAETVVKRGGATKVYCMATHGLFGGDCLQELEDCTCIHKVIVTNAFPIPLVKAQMSTKLVVLDVSGLLSEAIRRNHHGESISNLFSHYD